MGEPMRALTVRQPFAWAIAYGGKDVEKAVREQLGDVSATQGSECAS